MENKVIVEIFYVGKNFSAYVPALPGCVSTGYTPGEIKANIKEAIAFHVASSLADNDTIAPAFVAGNYQLVFKFDAESLLAYYKGIFTNAAFERITGISQAQISHYATGLKKPRPAQIKKNKTALHNLGQELLEVEL